jgi:hypothetical protein
MHPQQFHINEAWLAIRANTAPLRTPEGQFDVVVLRDAASMYILSQAFAIAGTDSPSEQDAASAVQEGWEAKQQWPKRLILVGEASSENGFACAARSTGIPVVSATPAELDVYISDVRTSFAQYFADGRDGDG